MSGNGWTVASYERRYLASLLDMLERTDHPTTEERFIWEFESNPVGEVNVHIALHADEVIGVACHNTLRLLIDGTEQDISFPLRVVTDPAFRGQGIFSTLEKACEERAGSLGYSSMLSFPNDQSTPIFIQKLGWTRLQGPRFLLRPGRALGSLDARNFAERLVPLVAPVLSGIASAVGKKQGSLEFEVAEEQSFASWADDLYEKNKRHVDGCLSRTSTYLNWRFVEKPENSYRIFRFRDGASTVGYMVTGTTYKRDLPFHFIASALFDPSRPELYTSGRQVAGTQNGSGEAAGILDLSGPRYAAGRAHLRRGFIPTPKRLHFIGKALRPEGAAVLDPDRPWWFQLGDLDFF